MEKTKIGCPLTTKQTWVLSTVALSGGLTKYSLEKLWIRLFWPETKRVVPLTSYDSFNMRKTLDSLVKVNLLKKTKNRKNITVYQISTTIPGLLTAGQPYRPYSRQVMTYLSGKYLGGNNGS